ncbi:cob(I)alamin adenosyltransferase [Maritalea mobilis]|uniref:Corrinoid adenosyltransferase n=1 Tax=Maritalea mobilis TaxID=483324 RepID=A0A4V3DAC4_9HYPH|nr:cob(I)yrinic acid a,c-diamide adenosyltransferase [Maritalea mobilis]TDQ61570.1 cob(I)alamin adenosyltransferase [Maritalea mobilis]
MVKLNKIYTKTGDDGTTGLVVGPRRPKFDLRVAAYGTVDEANSTLGLVRLHTADHKEMDQVILRVQNDLFDLGSDLATPDTGEDLGFEPLRIIASQVTWLEETIDQFNAHLEPIKSFTLPGGSALAAHLHLARTIVRRAERDAIELKAQEADVNAEAIKYLNRLSDLLFVLSRIANDNGASDILWAPGKHR